MCLWSLASKAARWVSPDCLWTRCRYERRIVKFCMSRTPTRALMFGQHSNPSGPRHRRRSCASPSTHRGPNPASSTGDPEPISPRVNRWRHREAETFPAQWAMCKADHDGGQNVHGRETRQQTSEHRSEPPQACMLYMYLCSKPACTAVDAPSLEPAGRLCEPLPWFRPRATASEEQNCAGRLRYRMPSNAVLGHTTGEDPRSRSTAMGSGHGSAPRSRNACTHSGAMAEALKQASNGIITQPGRFGQPVQPWYVNVSSNPRPSP